MVRKVAMDGGGDVDRPVIGEVGCGLVRRDMDGPTSQLPTPVFIQL